MMKLLCSWSGYFIDKNNIRQNSINPVVFTRQLLEKLGVRVQGTPLSQFLNLSYLEDCTSQSSPIRTSLNIDTVRSPLQRGGSVSLNNASGMMNDHHKDVESGI